MLHRYSENRDVREIVETVKAAIGRYRPRIVVHGDIMLDEYLTGQVERISPEAPIPIVAGTSYLFRLGGAANVAANLASLGAQVELAGIVGDDEAADRLEQLLEESSVGARNLIRVPGRQTTRKLRVVAGGQQIVRIDFEDTHPLAAEIVSRQMESSSLLVEGGDALVISDYNKGACGEALLSELIRSARAKGIPILTDPKGRSYRKYAGSTVITPNRKEAGEVLGVHLADTGDLAKAALEFRRSLAVEACVITLGADGMFLSDKDDDREIPAFSQDVADVTGAGDCAIAAMALALACGLPHTSSCVFANAVASISVTRIGSVAVKLEEVVSKYASSSSHRYASKLIPREFLESKIREMRQAGETVVFTNGCFDVFHAGHVYNLHQCAQLGSVVVVGLNGDKSVRALKGPGRPINSVADRAEVLMALDVVDAVVIFDEERPEELIRIVRPDVLAKGADYLDKEVVGREFVESYGGRVELIALKEDVSTTAILDKLKRNGV
ncbi:D-glycero-beta-D-manno-heptose 1-phosphate adenylyltransferase [Mesorhizobium sp. KR9-304]|uniref:D-glycero-beta-D-manno-heptose 1-phosphate adenylyltransferase n=1 Tax=Mesorhizobium sp. KR9-304 TaxID=3156614 RepID=UPI0032B62764